MMESASFKSPSGLAAAIQESASIKGALVSFLLTCNSKVLHASWANGLMTESLIHMVAGPRKVQWENGFWEIFKEQN